MTEGTQITKAQQVRSLKNLVDGTYYQEQFKNALGKNAGTFATSIMEVITNDDKLVQCNPNKLMQEAVKAASLKLPLSKQLGYAYLVPFNNKNKSTGQYELVPTLVLGYKGYVQLAIRSGQYKHINADIVYEGEYCGYDKLTGSLDMGGERKSNTVVGYFAYFRLLNGFERTLYIGLEDMAKYALRYSPTLKGSAKYPAPSVEELMNLAQEQADNGVASNGVGWKADFNSMAQKTVLRRLLSKYGYLSIEMQNAYTEEIASESAMNERNEANDNSGKNVVVLDESDVRITPQTAEVAEEQPAKVEDCPL